MYRYRFLVIEGLVDLKTLNVRIKVIDGSGVEYRRLSVMIERYVRKLIKQLEKYAEGGEEPTFLRGLLSR